MTYNNQHVEQRLNQLETHLARENPVLLRAVQSYRDLDAVAHRMGLLDKEESFAMQIPWWPLISILGTFSAGKSTFINNYLGMELQRSGNQAVDDKFTVICYSEDPEPHTLPGVSLDSDPRFPFYKFSREIEAVAEGEGARIDAYLQLKTCNSPRLKGKILIDSPGFDADAQRTSTLRITDHMIDLSDLVLVFFDARHPEPGAMRDTLQHLVANTITRPDSDKFLYILNQLDTAANEDNPEEVIAAWQRSLGEHGLTAGRFYTIYSPTAAIPIPDEKLRQRYEAKRDRDLEEIYEHMGQVGISRAYRIVGTLEKTAREIENKVVPILREALGKWKKRTLWLDAVFFGILLISFLTVVVGGGYWSGLWQWLTAGWANALGGLIGLGVVALGVHYLARSLARRSLLPWLRKQQKRVSKRLDLAGAFMRSTRPWMSIFNPRPAGWSKRTRNALKDLIAQADHYIQELNDRFTSPSGKPEPVAETSPTQAADAQSDGQAKAAG